MLDSIKNIKIMVCLMYNVPDEIIQSSTMLTHEAVMNRMMTITTPTKPCVYLRSFPEDSITWQRNISALTIKIIICIVIVSHCLIC